MTGGDLWHVEVFRLDNYEGQRFVAVSTSEALKLMEEALDRDEIGGVVAYRPPLQTGQSYEAAQAGYRPAAR